MNQIKKNIFIKDNNNKLGAIRLSFGIIGSLILAYLTIMLISKQLDYTIFENIVIGIILLPFFWSAYGLWIIMSITKFNAILKTIIPFIVLYILTYTLG
ncbi:hypothetical protein [Poseidonibacter lekithochrous]|uniref:hypothetical protein n=1 Tax=Poseidonibacter lekithochrous TaxID=1904463 RepID=UPI0008FC342D|nr:hypothetical protein [Poseidonibacter lekithochrous]QKJ21863.1 putative membrane protein [Poseidonibacter lekithochrous]